MTAVNKGPWLKNLDGAAQPLVMPGLVQAGSTQAIKRGELCVFDETSGYFVPVDAAADYQYSLAVSAQEQKSDDSARYINFYMPREGDVFELALSSAATPYLGDALVLVASQSQQLTRDVDGAGVAMSVGTDNYPQTGTTLTSKSYVQFVVNRAYSYWYQNILQTNLKKVITLTAAYTLKLGDCGAILNNYGASGAVVVTAPNAIVPRGWHVRMVVTEAQAFRFDPKPDTAAVIIKGAVNTAGKYASVTDEGDFMDLVWDGTNWIADLSISGADSDITIEG